MKKAVYFFNGFKNSSMQQKLIVSYFVLIFFPLVIVGIFAYSTAASSIKSEASRYISELLQQVNDNIDNSIAEIDRMTSIIGSDPDVQKVLQKDKARSVSEIISDDETVSSKINAATNLRPFIEGLFIFSYNGEVYRYKGANNSINPDYIFTRTRWFSAMKNLSQKKILLPTHLQDEVIGEGMPKKVFSYIKEINDIDTRKPIGTILIDMDPDVFKNILDNLNIRKYQELLVVDNNKTILYHTQEEYISTQFRSTYISKLLKQKKGTMVENINNQPVLITFSTSSVTNWTVISIIPIQILYRKITNLEYVIIITILLCMLLAFFLAVLLSRNITRPISELRALMKKAESGQFDVSIPVRTNDEIGELSLSFNHMLSRIKELIMKVYKAEILRKEAELNALQAQINPHFLYNTLQIMDVIAEKEGVKVISTVCQSLSRIFRYCINRGKEIVPLSSEIEHMKNYILIQKLRFGNKFDIIYNIEEELYNYQVIKLTLQPLVENALFHGVENKKGQCTIEVSAKKIENTILLTVEDTGAGMDERQLEALNNSLSEEIVHAEIHGYSQSGIGIKNVNARIKLYFGESYGVSIDSKLNVGTAVKVALPAIIYGNEGDGADAKNSNR